MDPQPSPDRHAAALDCFLRRLVEAVQEQAGGKLPRSEAAKHAWDLLLLRAPRANPNDSRCLPALCLAAMDLLGEWSPESLDLLFPLPG